MCKCVNVELHINFNYIMCKNRYKEGDMIIIRDRLRSMVPPFVYGVFGFFVTVG